ncbi:MAG: ribokinase [Lachnospiraceae bacterium]|uniref:ribokinase n=1 Tax=Parablautia sp. Marseille-Q6255 TaxID=3039593 RepID=UPI0024BCAC3F|nr:ribokinase [Parablautia sp. Marseille-Q6255]
MRDKIIVIGSLNYDIILKLAKLPARGETLPADDVAFSAGGKGANQAVQAAKLGVKTYMAGCVGNDAMGDFLLETAEKYGVDTTYIRRAQEPSGMGIVNAMEDGSVFATIVRGANFAITREDIDRIAPLMEEAGLLILQMEIPQEMNRYAIDCAKKHGCRVLLNAAPAAPLEEEYLQKCDILVVNEVEASFYAGRAIDTMEKAQQEAGRMAQAYGNTVIITMGAAGAAVGDGEKSEQIPSCKVQAVETTGAGDSFIGGVGYAVLAGMDIFDACRFATRCSAVTVCRPGAQPSMPTLGELEEI